MKFRARTHDCFSFLVILFFKSLIEIFNVSTSTSTNIGFKPSCTMGHKDVDQQILELKLHRSS